MRLKEFSSQLNKPKMSTSIRIDTFDEEKKRIQQIVITLQSIISIHPSITQSITSHSQRVHHEFLHWKELYKSVASPDRYTELLDIEPCLRKKKINRLFFVVE